jgi:predicted TIM-barrel fold metal-dependent hydrolase
VLDIHVHLFGVGDAGSGCRLSKATTDGPLFKLLAVQLGLGERAKMFDEGYVLALAEQVETSGLDKAVVLAQDAVYDQRGKPDWDNTHFYIPNDYLFQVVARYPSRMIPCVSINPDRADAIAELDRCAAKGARLLKIHPPTQGVDLADRKHTAFFRRCADLKVAVMVHTGHEHSAPAVNTALGDPRKLELALDSGCTVVACHCGTGWPQDHPDMLPDFLSMAGRYKNLWGDTAVLGSAGRVADFRRLLADQEVSARLLHGSDFPFPATPLAFAGVVGMQQALHLQAIQNWMEQDLALKEALGIGRSSAERAYQFVDAAMTS